MTTDNQTQITYLYSFLSYVYEQGHGGPGDILLPLIQRSIYSLQKDIFTTQHIQSEIRSLFTKEFPLIVIQRELNKLLKDDVIKVISEPRAKETKYSIIKEIGSYEEEYKHSTNTVDFFIKELTNYIQTSDTKYKSVSSSAVFKRLEDYCNKYFSGIMIFLTEEETTILTTNNESKREFDYFINDFINKMKTDEKLFNGFSQIFHGVTLLTIFEKCFECTNLNDYQLGEKVFFLDTNILLRFLEYQSEYFNKSGRELYNILLEYGFQMKAFRITVDELESLIRGYKYNHSYFVKGRDVSHIYQYFKDKDYIPSDIDRIIDDAHEKMNKLNIEIVEDDDLGKIDYHTYEEQIKNLASIKKEKYTKYYNISDEDLSYNEDAIDKKFYNLAKHDLKLIYLIRKYRKGNNRRFETTNYYVVTGEGTYIRYAKEMKDIDNPGQIEIIGDAILSFLLYFKNPNNAKGISVRNFIISNFDTQNLSPKLWVRYVNKVYTKFKNREISEKELGYLLTKTILNNDRISTYSMDATINKSINELARFEEERILLKKQATTISEKNIQISKEKNDIEKQFKELADRVDDITNDKAYLSSQYEDIKLDNISIKASLKKLRIIIFALLGLLLIISIITLFKKPIIGSISSSILLIINILHLIDYFKKYIIKD